MYPNLIRRSISRIVRGTACPELVLQWVCLLVLQWTKLSSSLECCDKVNEVTVKKKQICSISDHIERCLVRARAHCIKERADLLMAPTKVHLAGRYLGFSLHLTEGNLILNRREIDSSTQDRTDRKEVRSGPYGIYIRFGISIISTIV